MDIIRPAKRSDYREAARLIYRSGPDVLDFLFSRDGKSPRMFIEHSFKNGHSFFSPRSHYVVEGEAGSLVALGSFYGWLDHKIMAVAFIYDVATFYRFRTCLKILAHSLSIELSRKPPGIFSLYVCNFASSRSAIGRGLATHLFNYVVARRKYRRIRQYLCDVATDNLRAIELHERTGFRVKYSVRFKDRSVKPIFRMSMPVKA